MTKEEIAQERKRSRFMGGLKFYMLKQNYQNEHAAHFLFMQNNGPEVDWQFTT